MDENDLRSVRIEVEGESEPILDVAETTLPTRGSSRWPIVLIVALIAALGAVLVLLSPDGDDAADGSQRTAPTSTTTPAPDTAETQGEDTTEERPPPSVEEAVIPVTPPNRLDDVLIPTEVESASTLGQIIEINDGYLALAADQTRSAPQILSSPDGLVWAEIDSTISSPSGRDVGVTSWRGLIAGEDRFELIGVAQDAEVFRTELASSSDAATWTVLDDSLSSVLEPFGQPIGVRDDSVVAVGFRPQPIEVVLNELTDVEVGGLGVCRVLRAPGDEQQFTLFSCTGPESALLNAGNVLAGNDPDRVLDCIASLGNQVGGISVAFVDVGRTDQAVRPIGREESTWSPIALPTLLESGAVSFVDTGVRESPSCQDVIDLDPARDPSVVILDADTGEETVVALPVELDNGNGSGSIFGVEILGEARGSEDGSVHVLVRIDEQVWALRVSGSDWSLVYDTSGAGQVLRLGGLTLSTSGNRLYQPSVEGLRIIELEQDSFGALGGRVTVAALAPPVNFSTDGFLSSNANVATDDRLILTDGVGQNVWSIDLPPPTLESPPGFREDLGGTGLARGR